MAVTAVGFDTSKPVGQKLDPEMRAEVAALAPSSLDAGEVQTVHLADDAVTEDKIAPGAVGTPEIAGQAVVTANLKDKAVTTGKLNDGAVTGTKVGAGVMKAYDANGNALGVTFLPITATAYGQLTSPDPNTLYGIYPG